VPALVPAAALRFESAYRVPNENQLLIALEILLVFPGNAGDEHRFIYERGHGDKENKVTRTEVTTVGDQLRGIAGSPTQ
jgi:hypothetical protein